MNIFTKLINYNFFLDIFIEIKNITFTKKIRTVLFKTNYLILFHYKYFMDQIFLKIKKT
jgi:hypothetical protein